MTHQHNGLHHFTAVQAAYAKALGERQADFSGIERAGETITPNLDLWSRPEWAALRRETLIARHRRQPGVAAEFGFIAISNPATSKVLVTVLVAHVATVDGVARVTAGLTTAAVIAAIADATITTSSLDRRAGGQTGFASGAVNGVATISRGGGAAIIGASAQYFEEMMAGSGTTHTELHTLPVVLRPGDALFVEHSAVNLDIECSYGGYERVALPGELE